MSKVSSDHADEALHNPIDLADERQLHDPRYYSWENVGTLDFNVYRCQKTGLERFRT